MKNKKEKGRKWDGKSRVSNNVYRKRWNEIFNKKEKEKNIDNKTEEIYTETHKF